MPDIKISIIVPVYNSEKYLPETAQSILKQSFSDFELILVDDGSKDGSGKICDQLAAKDTRIKVIHKTNGGICSARNAGLKEAAGEYIAFCDNDDIYLPGLLEDNYALAKKYDADVVRYSRSYRTVKDSLLQILIRSTKPEKESGPVFTGELFYRKIRLILMKP